MNSRYQFTLEKGSKKHICPDCGKRRFVRYVDNQTGNYLPERYGRCDRQDNCKYHINPYNDGYEYVRWAHTQTNRSVLPNDWNLSKNKNVDKSEPVFIPHNVLENTLSSEKYSENVFIQNLLRRVPFPFQTKDVEKVISQYYLGTITSGYLRGAITFPFIDYSQNIRTIQVKKFDYSNHTLNTNFLHSLIKKEYDNSKTKQPEWLSNYLKNDNFVTCLFGEHLLARYPYNSIALVEAPKTAVYGTLYFGDPENSENLLWIAVYNKGSLSHDKLKVLKGKIVYVFPDLSESGSTYNEWKTKVEKFQSEIPDSTFIFSDLLESFATEAEKLNGNDLADYLIKLNWRDFRVSA